MPVVLAREVPIRRFHGYGEDSHRAVEFKADIERAWNAQPGLSDQRKLDLLLQNVGPIVRDELQCQTAAIQEDPAESLKVIVSVFGERRTPAQLHDALRQTRLLPGETVRLFSHRARSAFSSLVGRQETLGMAEEQETTLRDHFISAVGDPMLSRYLSETVASQPDVKFLAIREVAMRWARDETTASSVATPATSAAVSATPSQQDIRMDKVMDMVTSLAAEVGRLTKELATVAATVSRPEVPRNRRQQVYCYGCGRPGHRSTECPDQQRQSASSRSHQGNAANQW